MPSTTLSTRAFAGRDDLRAMEAIVSAAWIGPGRPLVHCTIGDLEWWLASGGPDVDWADRIRIWSIGGSTAAWGWFTPPTSLDWFVRDGLPEGQESAIRREILAWHAEAATTARAGESAPEGVLLDVDVDPAVPGVLAPF